MEWISVKDRLPKHPDDYLGFYGSVKLVQWNHIHGHKYWTDEMFDPIEVTHWMPLPEDPKS